MSLQEDSILGIMITTCQQTKTLIGVYVHKCLIGCSEQGLFTQGQKKRLHDIRIGRLLENMHLDHVAINVKNIKKSIEWYKSNFNCTVLYEDASWGFIEICGTRIALTINSQHPPHIAFSVESLEDLPGKPITHRDGSVSCYVKDPDGNYLEYIYWPSDVIEG